jgi:hypothetical protein
MLVYSLSRNLWSWSFIFTVVVTAQEQIIMLTNLKCGLLLKLSLFLKETFRTLLDRVATKCQVL